jgi:hypothetical protein
LNHNKQLYCGAFQVQIELINQSGLYFAGLSQANVTADFKVETPKVETMDVAFYGFGESREFEAFPADMLSQITKPTGLEVLS